jgi:hypothetical protein
MSFLQINQMTEEQIRYLIFEEPNSPAARRGRELLAGFRRRFPRIAPRKWTSAKVNSTICRQLGIDYASEVAAENLDCLSKAMSSSPDVVFSSSMVLHFKITGARLAGNHKIWTTTIPVGGKRLTISFQVITMTIYIFLPFSSGQCIFWPIRLGKYSSYFSYSNNE